jgi:hypothetical protein
MAIADGEQIGKYLATPEELCSKMQDWVTPLTGKSKLLFPASTVKADKWVGQGNISSTYAQTVQHSW